jgi:hypothetical protein
MHSGRLRWQYVYDCQPNDATREQSLWDAKRAEIVALIQNGITEQSAKQKLTDDRLAAEKKAREDQAADKAAAQQRAEADLAHTREAQAATASRKASVESQY